MRQLKPTFLLGAALLAAGASAGCSDEDLREAGRNIQQSVGQRWETWRRGIDDATKAEARRRAQAKATARPGVEPAGAGEAEQPIDEGPEAIRPATSLDAAGLAEIVAFAEQQRAQSLTVKLGGKTVVARRWGRQDDLHAMMQMTYPIVALTMGQLVAEGKIPSLDAPLGRWLPAFREGEKTSVTLRHVMAGRDQLKGPEPWPGGLYRQPDYLRFYAGTALEGTPGQGQVLPNESVVLLGAVVKAATGMPLDRWVGTRLFEPLGITRSRWRKDKAGNVDAWAGLWLPPAGALKIGELVLNEGRWNGRQVLPRDWVIEATSPAGVSDLPDHPEIHGYGWRVATRWRAFDTRPTQRRMADRRYGFQASDYIGNQLIVHPQKRLVALHTVPWDGEPITRSINDFVFDSLAGMLDEAAR
ncbi:MAG: serine hydrolase domain-containing protein [Candidatus Sericytochromatia bacterium]